MKKFKTESLIDLATLIIAGLALLVVSLSGCSKPATADAITARRSYCWSCEVTNYRTGVTRHADTCTVNNWAPQFKNEDGNDDNRTCTLNQ